MEYWPNYELDPSSDHPLAKRIEVNLSITNNDTSNGQPSESDSSAFKKFLFVVMLLALVLGFVYRKWLIQKVCRGGVDPLEITSDFGSEQGRDEGLFESAD